MDPAGQIAIGYIVKRIGRASGVKRSSNLAAIIAPRTKQGTKKKLRLGSCFF
jgi:hypothetical protein